MPQPGHDQYGTRRRPCSHRAADRLPQLPTVPDTLKSMLIDNTQW